VFAVAIVLTSNCLTHYSESVCLYGHFIIVMSLSLHFLAAGVT